MRLPRLGLPGFVVVVAVASFTAVILMKRPFARRQKARSPLNIDELEPNEQGTIMLRRYKRDNGSPTLTKQIVRSVIQELKEG